MSKRFYEADSHSEYYAQCRPTYPADIIDRILDYLRAKYQIKEDDLAIDIGCGSGQSTVLLAPHFQHIIGYDISEQQIRKANEMNTHPTIQYRATGSSELPHADSSVSLVISGQAAHWFDLPRFYAEIKRILKPQGVLALFGYAFVRVHGRQSEKLNDMINKLYHQTLDGFVQEESKEVYFGRYRDEKFRIPLSTTDAVRDESVTIECRWSIRRLLGYITSWSGSQYFLKQHPESTVFSDLRSEILRCLDTSDEDDELDLSFDTFIIMTDEKDALRCQYICPRKQRQCKMFSSSALSTYCMEHVLHDPDLDEATKESLRIPCPLNPLHSIAPHDLKRHVRRCNQRPMILGPFHRPNCNADASCDDDDEDDSLSLLHDMANDDLHRFIQHLESIHDSLVKEPLESSPTSTDFCLPDVNLDELGHRARKHLEQIGSIIAQMDQLDLLQSNTCFVEMGAGRGQLSHELHACLKNDSTIHFALIERDHQRYRFDAHHRLQHQGPSFKRYRLDIRDLYLPELPSIKATQPSPHIVIISKHLCGGATDLALRCAMEAQRDHGHIRAILIALCCHHRLMWNDYIGKAFFSRHNLTSKDFVLIRSLASWCTSGNRHRMPQEGKRSTIDGLSLQSASSLNADRSTTSKQRLFSMDEQEQIGLKAKRILDWGRIEYLNEHGFQAHLKVYASKTITLENIALIATPSN